MREAADTRVAEVRYVRSAKAFWRGIVMERGDYNIDVAHRLIEHRKSSTSVGHEILEIIEAVVLAMVAISTAWTGYQAALWSGQHRVADLRLKRCF